MSTQELIARIDATAEALHEAGGKDNLWLQVAPNWLTDLSPKQMVELADHYKAEPSHCYKAFEIHFKAIGGVTFYAKSVTIHDHAFAKPSPIDILRKAAEEVMEASIPATA